MITEWILSIPELICWTVIVIALGVMLSVICGV